MSNYINCISTTSTTEEIDYDGSYTLKIYYYPLDYFSLLDHFQFSYISYFILITSISFLIMLIFFIHLLIGNMIGKIKGSKYLSLHKFFFWFLLPYLRGTLIGIVPIIILICLIYIVEKSYVFYNSSPTWSIFDNGAFDSTDDQINYNYSRVSVYFMFMAAYCYYKSSKFLIPIPTEEKIRQIEKDKLKDDKDSNSNNSKNEEEDSLTESIDSYEAYDDIEVEMANSISWKQKNMCIKYIFVMAYVIFKIEYVFLSESGHLILKILIMNLFDFCFEEICIKIFFQEDILALPVLTMNRVTQFLYFLGSQSFQKSLICHIFLVFFNSFFQLYINPVAEKIEFMFKTKFNLFKIKHKNSFLHKLFFSFFIKKEETKIIDELDEQIEKIRFLQNKNKLTIESVLRTNNLFVIKIMELVLTPLVILTFYIFSEATHAENLFHLENNGLFYYLDFSIAIITPQLLIQMLIINYIEGIYGYRVQDYLGYCNFRYKLRNTDYLDISETMDISINSFYRSLDAFLFSDQFYLFQLFATTFLFCIMFACIIILINGYNPFDDPSMILYICFFLAVLVILNYLFKLLVYIFSIFKIPEKNNNKGLEFLILDANLKDIAKFMTTDLFREKFIKVNKTWIIENLEYVLGLDKIGEDLNDTNIRVRNKLEKIYQDALNYESIDNQIQLKKDLIKKDLDMMPYNQELIGKINEEFGIREDISKDSVIDEPNDIREKILNNNNITKEQINYVKNVAIIWRNIAREIMRFKLWSIDVLNDVKKNYCEKCNAKFNLSVFQDIPFNKLIYKYKKSMIGKELMMNSWQRFYKKNQIFITLCMECGYIRNSQFLVNQVKQNENNYKEKESKNQLMNGLKKDHVKGIAMLWLYNARTKILTEKMKKVEKKNKKMMKENNNNFNN